MYSIYVPSLFWFTFAVSFLGLVLALWLGLYLVSRSPKYLIAWLTALALWSIAGMYLNILLAIYPPPQPLYQLPWLRFLFPFWPAGSLAGSTNAWLQVWSVTPTMAFWHHVTTLMRPGKLTLWRWTRILFGYFMAILAIIVQTNSPFLFTVESSNPLYLNSLKTGLWYPIFGAALIILTLTCVVNLVSSAQIAQVAMLRKQLLFMATATLIAGLTGLVVTISLAMGLPIPMVVVSLLVTILVVFIGIGVVRYSALMEGRTIQQDFYYNLLLLALVILVYGLASGVLVLVYQAPAVIVVLIPVLAVLTHSLTTPVLRLMDRLFYRGETSQLRSNLRRLVRLAGEGGGLEENLARALETLCTSLRATFGLIVIFEGENLHWAATCHWNNGPLDLKPEAFNADDVVHLASGRFASPLEEAALLVPLYGEAKQLGALVLGRPINGLRYTEEDVENLLVSTDRIGETISIAHRKAEYLAQIAQLAEAQQTLAAVRSLPLPVETVENALRNLYDYAFLADTRLAELSLVDRRLSQGQVTHLERGKVVHEILLGAIDKLCPGQTLPRDPPPREWYPYLILRQAYVEEVSNRDIMQRLYISEGTFNRTRRSAIRSLARALGEMEAAHV